MENINISNTKDTQFDFSLTANGIDVKSGSVFFCVKQSPQMSIQIHCRHATGQKWSVKFPKGIFELGSHDYKLCVVVEDFYFEPIAGKLNVVNKDSVKVGPQSEKSKAKDSEPKNTDNKDNDKAKTDESVAEPIAEGTKAALIGIADTLKDVPAMSPKHDTDKTKQSIDLDPNILDKDKEHKSVKEESATNTDYTPSFDFFVTDHPYQQLPDGGEKDRRVRAILNSFKK